jgi:L-fucose isomerase-like protein
LIKIKAGPGKASHAYHEAEKNIRCEKIGQTIALIYQSFAQGQKHYTCPIDCFLNTETVLFFKTVNKILIL